MPPEEHDMTHLRVLLSKLTGIFRKARLEQQLDEDVRAHLEMLTEENLRKGMDPEEARYAALRQFGNVSSMKEECRETWSIHLIEELIQDIRYGLRQLRRNPGFTAVAIITLALGIGANTAIFSLVDAVMLKMLPVSNPRQLVVLNWAAHGGPPHGPRGYWIWGGLRRDKSGRVASSVFSYPFFRQVSARNQVFSNVAAVSGRHNELVLSYKGVSGRADGELVSGAFFSTLGISPMVGRLLLSDDDRPGASPVAVLSYGYWERRFGKDKGVLGRKIELNNVPFTIVGVSPPEFYGIQPGRAVDVWLPLHTQPQVEPSWSPSPPPQASGIAGRPQSVGSLFHANDHWWVMVLGRLKPRVSEQEAQANLNVLFQQSVATAEKPRLNPRPAPLLGIESLSRGLNDLRREFSKSLFVLMTLVGLILLIACANVANLLLARAASRGGETAVRLALGAGRWRLVRQFLTESVLLATLGGLAGMVFAFWATSLIVALLGGGGTAPWLNVTPDSRVLGFSVGVSILVGILFGLSPALRNTRVDLTPVLKEGSRSSLRLRSSGGTLSLLPGGGLVLAQVAISLLLLAGAGLFVRTLSNLENVRVGFDRNNLLLFGINPTQDGYKGERLAEFYQELMQKLHALPGVVSVTMSKYTLISGESDTQGIHLQGFKPHLGHNPATMVQMNRVGPQFFATMRIPLVLGRTINQGDTEGASKVAVVNQQFVRRYLDGRNPIGRRFGIRGLRSADIEIVGVVADAKYAHLRGQPPPTIYVPCLQDVGLLGSMHFDLRSSGNPAKLESAVRRVAESLDPKAPLYDLQTEIEQINERLSQERMFAQLTSFFGLAALLLACVGIYGSLSFSVAQRSHEIGIRMALGAEKSDVLKMVVGQGLKLTLIGVAIGIAGALALTRFLSSLLYGVKPTDPLTFIAVSLILIVVALLACYIPARRAAKVDPMVALRYE